MNSRNPLVFELLAKKHDRSQFDCGVPALNEYLKVRAGQELRRNIAFPYAMTFQGEPQIRGYYTLSATSVLLNDLPPELAKLTRYELAPSVLIGRLALDKAIQREGYGQLLLIDALRRIAQSKVFAVMLVIVEAKDSTAAEFYARFGFAKLDGGRSKMFLPFKTIAQL